MSKYSRHLVRPHARARRGFSLAECAFSLLLVALVMVGALRAISVTQRTRTEAQARRTATELGLRLLNEIRQLAYIDDGTNSLLGIELGESSRPNFDDVDDYDSYSESTLKDKDGTAVPGTTGYSRSCIVVWVSPTNPATTVSTDQGLKRITVRVTGPDGKITTLVGLRNSKGLGEQRPLADTTYVTWAGANITVGTRPPVSTGVDLVNGAK